MEYEMEPTLDAEMPLLSSVNESYKQLDMMKECASQFDNKPNKKTGTLLANIINAHLKTVYDALRQLDDGTISERNVSGMLGYVMNLESRRVDDLIAVDDQEEPRFTKVVESYEDIRSMAEDAREHTKSDSHEGVGFVVTLDDEYTEGESSLKDALFMLYSRSVGIDLHNLHEYSTEKWADKPSTKRFNAMKAVGRHTLDIAKVGIAGSIAGVVTVAAARHMRLFSK